MNKQGKAADSNSAPTDWAFKGTGTDQEHRTANFNAEIKVETATPSKQTDSDDHTQLSQRAASPSLGHLLGAADIRRIAAEAGISPTKKLGQNFVIDPGTVRRIAHEAGVKSGTNVLEVGPGLGSLTLALLETGANVTAVEIDPALASRLPQTITSFMPNAAGRLTVVNADALSLSPETLPQLAPDALRAPVQNRRGKASRTTVAAQHVSAATTSASAGNPFTLVSNLPYNVATPILLTLLERFSNLNHFTVMVQKEVADRLVAGPGSKIYGAPSAKLAWYGTAERAGLVSRSVFWPAPNVDSALVSFTRSTAHQTPTIATQQTPTQQRQTAKTKPNQHNVTTQWLREEEGCDGGMRPRRETVFRLVDAAFGQRRKTLHAALKGLVSPESFETAGIDPTRRGETLTIDEFTNLAGANGLL